jgi:putative peptidoglycan binding protein/N-acetylmuramoyl-L-alanine amidase-like protein
VSYTEIWRPTGNYSSRGGVKVRILTFHATEGAETGESLANWVCNPASEVSYHAAVDMQAGTVWRYVDTDDKHWAQANYNADGVSVAFCVPEGASAGWSRDDWLSKGAMLDNAAAIGRTFADWYGIPLVELSSSSAQGSGIGACQHANLGPGGSNHSDCGLGRFPMDDLIRRMGGKPGEPPSGGSGGGQAPPLHVDYFGPAYGHNHTHADVGTWQQQMRSRGWSIDVDSVYGPASEQVCRLFQYEKGLGVDGLVGPQTWAAAWTAPVT